MQCIACGFESEKLAKSHIIPNFVRKRLTGEIDENTGNKKFKFKWHDRSDLPEQDLPKPHLMCGKCDNELGANIEKYIAALIFPREVDDLDSWNALPVTKDELDEVVVDGKPFVVGKYSFTNDDEVLLNKFSMSVAWRALHAMAKEGERLSGKFLGTERGKLIDKRAIEYIFKDEPPYELYKATLYYLGPESAAYITNSNDEYPFAWAEMGISEEEFGIGVVFGCWVVLWPLGSGGMIEYFDHVNKFEKICFEDWLPKQGKSQLAKQLFA